ncbi:hypothetical protein F4781DRAFT_322377 [Annulohypoxylon bovei var. microspora]|nr:hypothetical protein F4781DRAFT_322377 [Annulohypoxylon bovei var. microspora]
MRRPTDRLAAMQVKANSWFFYLGPSKHDNHNSGNDEHQESDLSKGKARRAQVRKAQIQHRERKANYTKQLEMDVARLRDLIEQTERQSLTLRTENEAIRRRLNFASAPEPEFDFSFPQDMVPEYTVSLLASSESLATPLYQVQRIPTPSSLSSHSPAVGEGVQEFIDVGGVLGMMMSQAQVDHAINFILGLEHICWNHFHPSYYAHGDYDPEGKENGHMLMASALALRSAPPGVWEQISAENERRQQAPPAAAPSPDALSTFLSPSSNAPPSATTLTSWPLPPPPSTSTSTSTSAASHSHSHGHGHQHHYNPNFSHPTSSTTEPALTLESLYHLASSLNPASGPELAPVQAWFEIARLYGGAAVLDAPLMDRVRAALAPAVECLHFGAVIQRPAFEDAVAGVLGPVPVVVPGAI